MPSSTRWCFWTPTADSRCCPCSSTATAKRPDPITRRGPTPKRCYELGRGIRRFLDTRDERVAVVASSSWSHSFLAHKFQCRSIDIETDRRNLELVRAGQGSKLAELTPEEIQESGDHEILNWIIALGILGDVPAEIVDVRESHTQLAYRVAAIWN